MTETTTEKDLLFSDATCLHGSVTLNLAFLLPTHPNHLLPPYLFFISVQLTGNPQSNTISDTTKEVSVLRAPQVLT